jgi:hypothetical protein
MRVAISYRRTDISKSLELLECALIERFGAENVYKDLTTNKISESWLLSWSDAYINADVTLVIIGPNWCPERLENKKDPVRLEITGSLMRGVPLVPVLIDGALMPDVDRLPRFIRSLPWSQGIVIDQQRTKQDIAELLEMMERDTRQWRTARHRVVTALKSRSTPPISPNLTGVWTWKSVPKLLNEIWLQQNRLQLHLHAAGAYGDEIAGTGWITFRDQRVFVALQVASKEYGPFGLLILEYKPETDVLDGKRILPLPLWLAVFKRRPVRLERERIAPPMASVKKEAGRQLV